MTNTHTHTLDIYNFLLLQNHQAKHLFAFIIHKFTTNHCNQVISNQSTKYMFSLSHFRQFCYSLATSSFLFSPLFLLAYTLHILGLSLTSNPTLPFLSLLVIEKDYWSFKGKFYSTTLIIVVMLFRIECWRVKSQQGNKLDVANLKMLQSRHAR